MKLVLHPVTSGAVAKYVQNPAHALLLVGGYGMGKGAIAKYIASRLLGIREERLSHYPYYFAIQEVKPSISIDAIRMVQEMVTLKTPGTRAVRRVITIEDAYKLTTEAQNALLKLLEEPPADTVLLLTVDNTKNLLPTIVSRAQHIGIVTPTEEQLCTFFEAQGFSAKAVRQAIRLSQGYPGLLQTLLEHRDDHPMVAQIATAKELVSLPVYERLIRIDPLVKVHSISDILWALQRICHAALLSAIDKQNSAQMKRLQRSVAVLLEAQEACKKATPSKLLLMNVLLNI